MENSVNLQNYPEYLLDVVAKLDPEASTNPKVECFHEDIQLCLKYYQFERRFFIKEKCEFNWFCKLVQCEFLLYFNTVLGSD